MLMANEWEFRDRRQHSPRLLVILPALSGGRLPSVAAADYETRYDARMRTFTLILVFIGSAGCAEWLGFAVVALIGLADPNTTPLSRRRRGTRRYSFLHAAHGVSYGVAGLRPSRRLCAVEHARGVLPIRTAPRGVSNRGGSRTYGRDLVWSTRPRRPRTLLYARTAGWIPARRGGRGTRDADFAGNHPRRVLGGDGSGVVAECRTDPKRKRCYSEKSTHNYTVRGNG